MTEIQTLTFASDDWHVHLRDDNDGRLQMAAPMTAKQFNRAIVMPNLSPPVCTTQDAIAYRERIRRYVGNDFEPLMTSYLTDTTDAADLIAGHAEGVFTAAKLYPANATTNSAHGVTDIMALMPVFERMQSADMVLCIHGEVTDAAVDTFDREKVFIERTLLPLVKALPHLRIVFEHITTKEAVDFVVQAGPNVAATITPQHTMINRNALFAGGLRPHSYCLPVAKREKHRVAVLGAATSGNPKFFLGTDSAPHARHTKETSCGCAGCFTGLHALELYAEAFDNFDMVHMLPDFAGKFGADFYGLPLPTRKVRLARQDWVVPKEVKYESDNPLGESVTVVPFWAGETLHWRMVE